MQIIDELHKLERDLTGLMNLLYCMSDAADKGAEIDEGALMLLAEIAGADADTVGIIMKKAEEGAYAGINS